MKFPQLRYWQWLLVVVALAVALDWTIQRPDSRTRDLNAALDTLAGPELKAYPYQFRVLRVEGGVAVMSTPRNAAVPAFRALGVLYPNIDVRNADNPAFIGIEQRLGRVQGEARTIVASQPGITSVRWELDRRWLAAHGIDVPSD